MRLGFESIQRVGRALMLPIAVLPLAGLLLRLGQPDLLDLKFVAAAGDALFAHLGLLFAAGIAAGLAKDNNGAAGLAGVVCFLVLTEGAKTLLTIPPDVAVTAAPVWRDAAMAKLSVPSGILSGLVSGMLYNKFYAIRVPEYLAFFGGRRFVPLAAGGAGLMGAVALGLGLSSLESGIDTLSGWTLRSGPVGLFIYGLANRLLLVTGLHHVLNNMAWFVVGDFHGATGDLKRFFAGDPTAGAFMAGYFPVMMFGLPGACLAMWRAAREDQRRHVAGLFASLALTSLLTGVTEPIEFTFLFLAPLLYLFHAVMTGLSMVIMDALGVKLGFTFSAGLADYLINFKLATHPLLLLPVGLAYFAIYYVAFAWAIRRFNLLTPGRGASEAASEDVEPVLTDGKAAHFVKALGGGENIIEVGACTTRLRLALVDTARVEDSTLKALGAIGVVRSGGGTLQVILGPIADVMAGEIREWLSLAPHAEVMLTEHGSSRDSATPPQLDEILKLVGSGVVNHAVFANRVLLTVASEPLDPAIAAIKGVRGIAKVADNRFQVVLDSV